jgi:hypothetical protein
MEKRDGFWSEMGVALEETSKDAEASIGSRIEELGSDIEKAGDTIVSGVERGSLFGFDIPGGKTQETMANLKARLLQHNKDAEKRKKHVSDFEQKGIRPIAVVPEKIFDTVCGKLGLYQFEKVYEIGQVAVRGISYRACQALRNILAMSISTMLITSLAAYFLGGNVLTVALGCCLTILFAEVMDGNIFRKPFSRVVSFTLSIPLILALTYTLAKKIGPSPMIETLENFLFTSFVMGAAFVIGGLISAIIDDSENLTALAEKIILAVYGFYCKHASREKLAKFLWPHGSDISITRGAGEAYVNIKFPEAPISFLEKLKLMKINDVNPMIAAHWSGITIDSSSLIKRWEKGIEAEKERRKREQDPILYHRQGGNVMIIDHFGHIPEEEQLIKWAKSEMYDILVPQRVIDDLKVHQN